MGFFSVQKARGGRVWCSVNHIYHHFSFIFGCSLTLSSAHTNSKQIDKKVHAKLKMSGWAVKDTQTGESRKHRLYMSKIVSKKKLMRILLIFHVLLSSTSRWKRENIIRTVNTHARTHKKKPTTTSRTNGFWLNLSPSLNLALTRLAHIYMESLAEEDLRSVCGFRTSRIIKYLPIVGWQFVAHTRTHTQTQLKNIYDMHYFYKHKPLK